MEINFNNLTEMQKLGIVLHTLRIPWELTENSFDHSPQIWYPSKAEAVCDAICHSGSYGGPQGYLEIMGLVDEDKVGDTVEGWLTAEEVAARIIQHHLATK